ncbi:MAG TPA: acetyl-CoA C-acyltransferase [Flavobacteriaceae bacterium]|nr:acetyl-CoA C-acyltransferase [Flavobacteriaceae bacterium]
MSKEVVIVSGARTPVGSFMGSLSSIPATKLGSIAIKGALDKINLDPNLVNEVFMGNVLQAGLGQAPARQASLGAGISDAVPCTTVNKVCASGMKAMMFAAQSIALGDADIVVAGGMESMSRSPHYLQGRKGVKLGNIKMDDGMLKDGLIDAYSGKHMGTSGDSCARDYNFTREDVDAFAIQSYERSKKAWDEGKFDEEVVPVEVPQRKGDPIIVKEDEEYKNVKMDKISSLRPVFTEDGTTTAANASTLNDGASAVVMMSKSKAEELGLKALATIVSYADAAQEPEKFTSSPAISSNKALEKANLTNEDISYFEFNEAFSVVGLANTQIMKIDPDKVNVNGGAVSLGHPLGSSGSRIMITLMNVLKQNNGKFGLAGICNGGGGASSMIIKNNQ